MASRADEVEVWALAEWLAHDADQRKPMREAAAALREYAQMLREDRCAPLLEALEQIDALPISNDQAWVIAHRALSAYYREREGGEDG